MVSPYLHIADYSIVVRTSATWVYANSDQKNRHFPDLSSAQDERQPA